MQLLPLLFGQVKQTSRGPWDTDAFPESQSNVNVIHTVLGVVGVFGGDVYIEEFVKVDDCYEDNL